MRPQDALAPVRAIPRYLVPAMLGAAFAAALYPVWGLEGRWFYVTIAGLVMLSASMAFAGRFGNFVMILTFFCIPVAGFTKWIGLDGYDEDDRNAMPTSGMFGVGITDFMIAGLYLSWAFRILVLRSEPMPRLRRADVWVLLMIAAATLSIWGAFDRALGFYALEHVVKHALYYFYVSRHFRREHIPWLLGAIAFAIALEAVVAGIQNRLGILLGLMADKGAGGEKLESLYDVPGIEGVNRAMGTTYDPHALGLYLSMLLPFALVYLYTRGQRPSIRTGWALLIAAGLPAVVVTYARSGWISCALAIAITYAGLLAWRERHVLASLIGVGFALLLSAHVLATRVLERFTSAPSELVRGRFEQYPIAWSIWQENLLFGFGGGNYMLGMRQHNLDWAYDLPVHNVALFIGAEQGLLGVVAYYGLVASTLVLMGRLTASGREPERRIALASIAAVVAAVFDGMSNPHFREPTLYLFFWLIAAMAVAFTPQRSEK